MHCDVTLTADEFKTIHNILWELEFSKNTDPVQAAGKIREALKGAYAQDNQAFSKKHDHYSSIKEQFGFASIWSLYEVTDLNAKHNAPSDAFVVYEGQHCAVYGETWVDIYRAADNCIRNSGDQHHIFIEGFELKNGNELHMYTGS